MMEKPEDAEVFEAEVNRVTGEILALMGTETPLFAKINDLGQSERPEALATAVASLARAFALTATPLLATGPNAVGQLLGIIGAELAEAARGAGQPAGFALLDLPLITSKGQGDE